MNLASDSDLYRENVSRIVLIGFIGGTFAVSGFVPSSSFTGYSRVKPDLGK
jgi:hypothetical protein